MSKVNTVLILEGFISAVVFQLSMVKYLAYWVSLKCGTKLTKFKAKKGNQIKVFSTVSKQGYYFLHQVRPMGKKNLLAIKLCI